MNTYIQRIMIAAFCLLISLPLTGTLLQVGTLSSQQFRQEELRQRERFPKVSKVGSVSEWTGQFGKWFNDRYAFRQYLSKAHVLLQHGVFKQSAFPDSVVIGKNNFLFLGNSKLHFQYLAVHAGIPVTQDAQLDAASKSILTAAEWLGTQHIPLLISIAPDKATIYGEYLPDWIFSPNRNLPMARIRDMTAAREQRNFHYSPEVLLEAKKHYPDVKLYYASDTHWNELGAFIYYQDTMRHLEAIYGAPLRMLKKTTHTSYSPTLGFDLGIFLKAPYTIDAVTLSTEGWPLLPEKFILTPTTLSTAPPAGFAEALTINPQALNPQKILILGDSFSERMMVFIHRTFRYVLYLHSSSSSEVIAEAVKWFKPDLVLFEVVERSAVNRLAQQ